MRIVCFGDSVTRGISYISGRLRILKENYPALVQQALLRYGEHEVVNKGVFNDNSTLLCERLEKDVLALHPDYVLIEIGGNDCNFRWNEVAVRPDDEHEAIVPLQIYIDNVRNMVGRIRESGAVPVLMSLLPLDPVRYYQQLAFTYDKAVSHWIGLCGGIAYWHGLYNRALKELIATLDVMSIDVRTAFKQAADLGTLISDDGIHPTADGYQIMSQAVLQRLLPLIEH